MDSILPPDYHPAIQPLEYPAAEQQNISIYLLRDDLNHPLIQGNKWHKLNYNLTEARKQNSSHLITFGGQYSNHILATAAAGHQYNFKTTGIIRGYEQSTLTCTLKHAAKLGMKFEFIDRATYRKRNTEEYKHSVLERYHDAYLIPEGGSNSLAVSGIRDFIRSLQFDFDVITTACGTGGTLSGIISALQPNQSALGFAVLKNADFLNNDIQALLNNTPDLNDINTASWHVTHDYHFGGYAKTTKQLNAFILDFYSTYNIPLEPVYTGKMLYGLFDLVNRQHFKPGTRILAYHTGGLQGLCGYPQLIAIKKAVDKLYPRPD